ncbi:MAG: DegT/DnrJ/EryC1/StrS aminotransferase family protein [Deltaproteobacteria bacterium]|nr:MAG: DegT/DnrJ/EryC1/StrS aminotransferase family protein [Deltaproteobacteria bacterium]
MKAAALRVPLFDLDLGPREQHAVQETLRSGWLTLGPTTARFEAAFAAATGAGHAVAVSSGTAALHLALAALGVGPGDEVICPALTFVATANAIRYVGATPVFCDIRGPDDLNLDPADVDRRITDRTRAVIAVHYAGYPADMPALASLCDAHGLWLVEDAAHACISRLDGRACGTLGDVGCFSFFSNKNITCGEGGALTTDDADLAARLRLLRSHGMTTGTVARHRGEARTYDVVALGYNYRIDELRSAILLAQLDRLPGFLARRRARVAGYRARLAGSPIRVPGFGRAGNDDEVGPHIMPVLLPEGTDRAAVMDSMRAAGVQTSIHYPPVHRLREFRDPQAPPLPRTEAVAARELTLPLYPTLGESQLDLVCDSLRAAVGHG